MPFDNLLRQSLYLANDPTEAQVAVLIASIPPRAMPGSLGPFSPSNESMLERAISSAYNQTVLPAEIHIVHDHAHAGAGTSRQTLLRMVSPGIEWVAFLDDDDYWYPEHLQTLLNLKPADADVLYSWFDGNDPFPQHRGRVFDPADPHHITMNIAVRRRYADFVGFRTDHPEGWTLAQEDWRFIQDLVKAGATFAGTDNVTWHYSVHEHNTSGLGSRW